jgi:transcriptional regulator with XRE-family HTH domain
VDGVVRRRIREERLRNGMTQTELAEAAGVSTDTISTIERGHHIPRPSTMRKLAKVLGVRVPDLYQEPTLAGKVEAPQETGPVEHEEVDTLSLEEEESGVVYARRGIPADEVLPAVDEILSSRILSSSLADATDRPGEPLSRLEIITHSDGSTDLVIRRVAKHAAFSRDLTTSKARYVTRSQPSGKQKRRKGRRS